MSDLCLVFRLSAEACFRNDVASDKAALQNERDGARACLADHRLRFAQRLRRDVGGESAIRQADPQPGARLAVLDRDGGELGGVEDQGDLEPIRGEGRARRPRELAWSSQAAAWRLGGRSSLASLCGEGRGGIFIAVDVPIWARPPGEQFTIPRRGAELLDERVELVRLLGMRAHRREQRG